MPLYSPGVRLVRLLRQVVEPAYLRFRQVRSLHAADRVPDAREPVRDQREARHQQQQLGGAVLRVAVELTRDAHQSQEARRLQQADQRRRLQRNERFLVAEPAADNDS